MKDMNSGMQLPPPKQHTLRIGDFLGGGSGSASTTPPATSIDAVLNERGSRYGPFEGHAEVTQNLKAVITRQLEKRSKRLKPDQQEALDMICHKIGRIVNGDPDYDDSWVDIAGYSQLIVDRLRGSPR